MIRRLPWPLFKRVPDVGGEVARAIGHFLDQPGNQQVIDELLARGVTDPDTHAARRRSCAPDWTLRHCWWIWKFPRSPASAPNNRQRLPDRRGAAEATRISFVGAGLPADTAQCAGDTGWQTRPTRGC